ncbi:MAG: potassium-transporting ATPase subunit C [Mycobacteriaceae bacterium]|nr:potassium-transporting ATPase subunit C [Mycobacteriaceae bacterium]
MNLSNLGRQHWAALRALMVLTVILGIVYPVFIWLVAQLPGLNDQADGSLIDVDGNLLGSSLIGQSFTDADGNVLPQYFQSRPSAASDGYDPMATSASNLGPESIVDSPDKPSLLTLVCERSATVGRIEGVDGRRPFCTGDGVGAVLSVIGPRDAQGKVVKPTRVVSVNEPCATTQTPFLDTYEGVRVECATPDEDYGLGQLVPIRGSAPANPVVPADAVTASGSGLDPHISIPYADLQVSRVATARGINPERVRDVLAAHTDGRFLGFFGEPTVNVLLLNLSLDQNYPTKS